MGPYPTARLLKRDVDPLSLASPLLKPLTCEAPVVLNK